MNWALITDPVQPVINLRQNTGDLAGDILEP